MKKDKELKEKIIKEYLAGGTSYNALGRKYGYAGMSICDWVHEYEGRKRIRKKKPSVEPKGSIEELPKEVNLLQSELRRTKLRNKLLEEVIRLAKEELGIDLIKKTGTKRS
jgi:transposase-like protein